MPQMIKISDIKYYQDLQVRAEIDQATVKQYQDVINELPPIAVMQVGSELVLVDGMHRIKARISAGQEVVAAHIYRGTMAEALEKAIELNRAHGKPLSLGERKEAVRKYLKADPEKTHRYVSRLCGISDKTVKVIREELESAKEIPILDTLTDDAGREHDREKPDKRPVQVKEAAVDLKVTIHFASESQKKEFLGALDMAKLMTGSESMAYQAQVIAQEFMATYRQMNEASTSML